MKFSLLALLYKIKLASVIIYVHWYHASEPYVHKIKNDNKNIKLHIYIISWYAHVK